MTMLPSSTKKAGRPATDPAARHAKRNFTLSPAALDLLDQLAAHWGHSKSGAVERAIREAAEREARRRLAGQERGATR